jgi:hypothetical protein
VASLISHTTPSVGGVVKKMLAINPDLTTKELIELVRQAIIVMGADRDEFAGAELIDEEKALELARSTLVQPRAVVEVGS